MGVGFVVAGQSAVVHEPAEGPLDHPTPGNRLESFGSRVALDDFDVDPEAGTVVDHLRAVSGVGPCLGHVGACAGDLGEQVDAAGVVGDAGLAHPDGRQQSEGVDTEVALTTSDFLACVDALIGCRHVGGGLDALSIQHAGARLCASAFGFTDQASQQAVELVEDAFLLRSGEVAATVSHGAKSCGR